MKWNEYVKRVIGNDKQIDVARKSGIDQTTISRWLNPSTDATRRTSQTVAAFARAYDRPVLEAFVVAGFLTSDEAGVPSEPVVDLSTIAKDELLAELNRRLSS